MTGIIAIVLQASWFLHVDLNEIVNVYNIKYYIHEKYFSYSLEFSSSVILSTYLG